MDIKQIYREETNLEPHFDVGLDCITCFSIEYVKWLEAKLTLTHDVKSDSEQLMNRCSVCGIHKHPVAGAKCKASNCLNEN
jgi:hypothetical protein